MTLSWVPNHCHDHTSLLDGLSKPKQIAERCYQLGYTSCTMTNHGNASGAIQFVKEMKKKNIKPILGCEMYITQEDATNKSKDNGNLHQIVLAKNKEGWKDLIKLISRSNDDDVFYNKPRIDYEILKQYSRGNLISMSGHPGSILEVILKDKGKAEACRYVNLMQAIFGPENFFIEIQKCGAKSWPYLDELADALRSVAEQTDAPCLAVADCHYPTQADASDHRVLLCSSLNTTMNKIETARMRGERVPLAGFFENNVFHIPEIKELLEWGNTEEEIQNAADMAEMCENYDIASKPRCPKFIWTDGMSEADYLRKLCAEGWKRLNFPKHLHEKYGDRVRHELSVINGAGLAGYFLIVQDYVNWAKNEGYLIGPGRGSAGGCLVSLLLNITSVNPMPYDLIFERFYNAGRNTADHISYPDIDIDFPINKRGNVIDYIRQKYGHSSVGQISTYGRLQGRGAVKEVFRIQDVCSHTEINQITKSIPQEHEINDELEASQEDSIIRWTLQNTPKALANWCQMQDDGTLTGDYALHFAQAIRLEGTYKTQGKHAAAIVIADGELGEICPLVRDKSSSDKLCAFDMRDVEYIGLIKMDILGVAKLDVLMGVNDLLIKGRIDE